MNKKYKIVRWQKLPGRPAHSTLLMQGLPYNEALVWGKVLFEQESASAKLANVFLNDERLPDEWLMYLNYYGMDLGFVRYAVDQTATQGPEKIAPFLEKFGDRYLRHLPNDILDMLLKYREELKL